MPDQTTNGVITLPSQHSVDDTLAKLQQTLQQKGVHIFAVVDHSGEAERAGLQMPNTKLVIFGNPKAGTPLMLASPTLALDLPLKILLWEDSNAKSWISYNSPQFLANRHSLNPELTQVLAVAGALAEQLAH
jgi:uncharacterized protein (DUF302 family)